MLTGYSFFNIISGLIINGKDYIRCTPEVVFLAFSLIYFVFTKNAYNSVVTELLSIISIRRHLKKCLLLLYLLLLSQIAEVFLKDLKFKFFSDHDLSKHW